MAFLIVIKPSVRKELDRIPPFRSARIRLLCAGIARDPYGGKKLKGGLKGYYAVRAWPYRIVYRIHAPQSLVIITRIGHRQGVY